MFFWGGLFQCLHEFRNGPGLCLIDSRNALAVRRFPLRITFCQKGHNLIGTLGLALQRRRLHRRFPFAVGAMTGGALRFVESSSIRSPGSGRRDQRQSPDKHSDVQQSGLHLESALLRLSISFIDIQGGRRADAELAKLPAASRDRNLHAAANHTPNLHFTELAFATRIFSRSRLPTLSPRCFLFPAPCCCILPP